MSYLTFKQPDTRLDQWGEIPIDVRNQVKLWIKAFEETPIIKPIKQYFLRLAAFTGTSEGTAKRHYYALKNGENWTCLVPKSYLGRINPDVRTNNRAFRYQLVKLAEGNHRNSAAAIRRLYKYWRRGDEISGYEDKPNWPQRPPGWSKRRLTDIIKEEVNKAALQSIRIGTSSKTNPNLPQVFTTRTGLWPGAVYQIDDVWHDNFVTVGKDQTPARVIEIGALDLFSAARIKFGAKPRLKVNGVYKNLNEEDVTFFLAGLFHETGYSPRGTMLMAEHGAAAVTERIERILYDASGGVIRLDRQPIEGKQQALTGFWGGTEGGNFRAKAALESQHNLMHNDLGHLPLQTGLDSGHRPVITNRQLQYISRIIKAVIAKAPHRAHQLRLPSLDFHSQFLPLLYDYYRYGLNERDDHELEGWRELGFFITEYTALPGSDQWLSPQQFLELPEASQRIITENVKTAPKLWSHKRNLSPWEVWSPARSNMLRIPDHTVAEMLGKSMAREEIVKKGFFHWHDQTTPAAQLIYEARLLTPHGTYQPLHNGEKFAVFCNPFEDRWLFVTDARGVYLGKAELVKRVNPINPDVFQDANPWEQRRDIRSDELKKAAGHKRERIAEIHEPSRIRHLEEVRAKQDLVEHTRLITKDDAVTPEEKAQKRSAIANRNAENRRQKNERAEAEDAFASLADISEDTDETPTMEF